MKSIVISINASWNIINFRSGLVRALRRAGYRIVALAPRDAYSDRLEALGMEFVPLPMDTQGISPFRDILLCWRYYKMLRSLRPAIFLGYTAKPNIYGSIAAHALGIKVINNVSGLGTAFIREDFLTRIVTLLYKLALRRSATVFFQNRDDCDLFLGHGIVKAAQARLLPGSGIDLDHFRPSRRRAKGDFRFLLVARLLWFKGIREYVEAARLVRKKVPEARFQLLGFLDPANRNAVSRSDVERWVGEDIMEYLGEADDVRPFVAAADCVVLPSYREGLPRTLLEAAAMGKPLIATDVPGCRHVVEHEVNGLLCLPRDADSLAEAMLKMLRLPAARKAEMGAAARAKVEAQFDEQIAVGLYLEAVRDALKVLP